MTTVGVCLVSHTNAGKTTLARTLLRRDVGEVGDRAHVTQVAESHVVIASGGDALVLWDTPGFGDSVRLLRRLRGNDRPLADPVAWFLSAVWDRYADRPFWCSQQAMRSARDAADVVLYVANAAEDPETTAWVAPELEILAWLGRPVLVLLNQLGGSHDAAALDRDLDRWRAAVAPHPIVRGVLPFDAFARCWVQEHVLLDALAPCVPEASRHAYGQLRDAWRERDLRTFDTAVQVLARQLATLAADREPLAEARLTRTARAIFDRVAGRGERDPAEAAAEAALAARLDAQVRDSTDALVRLHGLAGGASGEILQRMGREVDVRRAVDPGSATLVGGLVSGAVGGLAADLAAGGLTLGAGALIGGVLGALGARGAARAYNVARGAERGDVRWSAEFLDGRAIAAIARYLAVAHFGRGRGDYVDGTVPDAWVAAARAAVDARRTRFADAWRLAEGGAPVDGIVRVIARPLREALVESLESLHPAARGVLGGDAA